MTFSTFFKLVGKAFRFSVNRPLQRFNIYNRSKKYLGPDAKKFMPAPRAIGALSQNDWRGSQYPHLEPGYKSIKQKRLAALNKPNQLEASKSQPKLSKSFSETKTDDNLIIEASHKLAVMKTIVRIQPTDNKQQELVGSSQNQSATRTHRPLPKCTNLQLSDLTSIWAVEKTPKGRINLNMLQELMLNKLADEKYWTPKMVAERYNIKEEYAESLLKYILQIRVVVSPKLAKALDYVARNDTTYQASKDLVYFVDNRLRTEDDKRYDEMFLPGEDLDEEVRAVLDAQHDIVKVDQSIEARRRRIARPQPLRVAHANKPETTKEPERQVRKLAERKESGKSSGQIT